MHIISIDIHIIRIARQIQIDLQTIENPVNIGQIDTRNSSKTISIKFDCLVGCLRETSEYIKIDIYKYKTKYVQRPKMERYSSR